MRQLLIGLALLLAALPLCCQSGSDEVVVSQGRLFINSDSPILRQEIRKKLETAKLTIVDDRDSADLVFEAVQTGKLNMVTGEGAKASATVRVNATNRELWSATKGGGWQMSGFSLARVGRALVDAYLKFLEHSSDLRVTRYVKPPVQPIKPAGGDLTVTVLPGSAQLYLDDEPKGLTSPEGRIVLKELSPGDHKVRVNLPRYKVLERVVSVKPGQTSEVQLNLQRSGPDPFTEQEIEDGLQKGVTPARMKSLVEEIGVSFTVTDDVDKRLRAAGADDALLYAIVRNKR